MMGIAAATAAIVHRATGYSAAQLLLPYAQGGVNEMSLAILADVAFVATITCSASSHF